MANRLLKLEEDTQNRLSFLESPSEASRSSQSAGAVTIGTEEDSQPVNRLSDFESQTAETQPERTKLSMDELRNLTQEQLLQRDQELRVDIGQFLIKNNLIESPEAEAEREQVELDTKRQEVATRGRTAFEEAKNSLERGGLNVVAGLGGTLEELARLADKPILNQLGEVGAEFAEQARISLKDPELTPTSFENKTPGEKVKLFIAQTVPETLSFMVGTTVATILGGPVAGGAFAFSVEGENAFQDALNSGATSEEANIDRLVVGTINAALEQLQVKNVLKFGEEGVEALARVAKDRTFAAIKEAGKEVTLAGLKQFITEGLQEATQEAVSIATPAVRTGDVPDLEEAAKQIGIAGLAGGVSGVLLGGGAAGVDAISSGIARKQAELEAGEDIVTPTEKTKPAEEVINRLADIEKETKPAEKAKKLSEDIKKKVEAKKPAPKADTEVEQVETEKTAKVQQEVSTVIETDFTKDPTSARKESVKRDRESLGLDVTNSKDRKSWEESLQQAKKEGVSKKASRLAAEIIEEPRSLNDVETAGMTIRMAELKKEHAELTKEIAETDDTAELIPKAAEIQRVEDEFDDLTRAVSLSGTEKGRALAAQKLTINKDFDLISVLNRAKVAKRKTLSAREESQFKRLTEDLQKSNEKIGELQLEVFEIKALNTIKKGAKRFTRMSLVQKDRNLSNLVAETNELLKQGCNN